MVCGGVAREDALLYLGSFIQIFIRDAINVEQWLQGEEKGYMKVTVNNIPHVFSSPEAYSDTNKSFKMFHPLLHTVHQTALLLPE